MKEEEMADAIEKSMDKKIEGVARAVPSKTGEVSDTDLEKVAGGTDEVTFEYGALQVRYTQQS
jgi:hypothetical protein